MPSNGHRPWWPHSTYRRFVEHQDENVLLIKTLTDWQKKRESGSNASLPGRVKSTILLLFKTSGGETIRRTMEGWKRTWRSWRNVGTGSSHPDLLPSSPPRGSHGCLASKQADRSRPLHHQCRHRGSPADRPYTLAGHEGLGQALGGRGQRPHLGGGQVGKLSTW